MTNNMTSFFSKMECENQTAQCFSHGDCSLLKDSAWVCVCKARYDVSVLCEKTFYDTTYGPSELLYPSICLILSFIGYVALSCEMYYDIKKHKVKTPNFIAKLFALLFFFFRFFHYGSWFSYAISGQINPTVRILDIITFDLSLVIALSAYAVVLLTWIQFFQKATKLSNSTDSNYIKHRNFLIVSVVIFGFIEFILSVLNVAVLSTFWTYTFYHMIGGLYLFVLFIWSTYQIISLKSLIFQRTMTNHSTTKILKRKTLWLVVVNILFFIYALILVIYISIAGNRSPWPYLHFMVSFRVTEFLIFIFFFCVVHTNLGPKLCSIQLTNYFMTFTKTNSGHSSITTTTTGVTTADSDIFEYRVD